MNLDGSNQTNLTRHPANDYDPEVTPDGENVIFVSQRTGRDQVFIVNIYTGVLTNLSNNIWNDRAPRISPNGRKIVFESTRGGNSEIYIMNIDGSEQTNLTNHSSNDLSPIFWSEETIAFSSNRDGNDELYRVDVDGSHLQRLTFDHPHFIRYDYPAIAAKGKLIYLSFWNAAPDIGRYPPLLTTNGDNWNPHISPDGTLIVYRHHNELWTMDINGNNKTQLISDGYNDHPQFSPDGTKILYTSPGNFARNISMMDVDGQNQHVLTNQPDYYSKLRFIPVKKIE